MIQKLVIVSLIILLLFKLPEYLRQLKKRLKRIDKKIEDLPRLSRRLGEEIEDLPRASRRLGEVVGEKIKDAGDLLESVGEPGGLGNKIEELAGKRVLEKRLAATPAIEKTKEAETVAKIGRRLAACSRRNYIPFRFFVVDNPGIPNGYAIPGGSILITQALLDICPSEDEIAGVLAHEVAHIDHSHSLKRLWAARAIRNLVGINNSTVSQAAYIFEQLIECGYSQDNEFEADREGALLAKKAGFDPLGNMKLLKMMGDVSPAEEHSYFSTHPPRSERINELRKLFG